MRDATRGATAESARSWYWLKCTELGYLQSAPQLGLSTRPRSLTTEKLLQQCAYIFGDDVPLVSEHSVEAFNRKHGGGTTPLAPKTFVIDYSDDPRNSL